jgi:hypothetical protein
VLLVLLRMWVPMPTWQIANVTQGGEGLDFYFVTQFGWCCSGTNATGLEEGFEDEINFVENVNSQTPIFCQQRRNRYKFYSIILRAGGATRSKNVRSNTHSTRRTYTDVREVLT